MTSQLISTHEHLAYCLKACLRGLMFQAEFENAPCHEQSAWSGRGTLGDLTCLWGGVGVDVGGESSLFSQTVLSSKAKWNDDTFSLEMTPQPVLWLCLAPIVSQMHMFSFCLSFLSNVPTQHSVLPETNNNNTKRGLCGATGLRFSKECAKQMSLYPVSWCTKCFRATPTPDKCTSHPITISPPLQEQTLKEKCTRRAGRRNSLCFDMHAIIAGLEHRLP